MIINNKKICHIVLLADLSGSKQSMLEIFKNSNDSQYEKYVMSNGKGQLIDVLAELGITSLKVNFVREIRLISDIKAFFSIYSLCRKHKFDIVHTHSSKTGILGRIAARLAGVKLVVHHVRGFAFHEFSGKLEKIFYCFIEKIAGWFCDKVIFVNNEERLYSIRKHILPESKCVTILNGIDFSRFDITQKPNWREEIRTELKISPQAGVVTFVGRLDEQKDPVTMYKIIVSYFEQTQNDTYFLILGDGPYAEKLKQDFRTHPWFDRVLMLGWKDQIAKFLAASDILFLPSLWEGMPRTILEAMAMGLPVVCSDIKGNREAVDNTLTGYLLPPREYQSFVQKLTELLTDENKRNNFGRNAFLKAQKHYNSTINSKKIIELYETLLKVEVADPA